MFWGNFATCTSEQNIINKAKLFKISGSIKHTQLVYPLICVYVLRNVTSISICIFKDCTALIRSDSTILQPVPTVRKRFFFTNILLYYFVNKIYSSFNYLQIQLKEIGIWKFWFLSVTSQKSIFSNTNFSANLHFLRRFVWGIKHKNRFFFQIFSPKGPPFDI